MSDCIIDDSESRFRIEVSDIGNYNWKFQALDYGIARELCLRVAQYIRHMELFGFQLLPTHKTATPWPMMELVWIPYLSQRAICMAYEPKTGAIQVNIEGLEKVEALVALEDIAHIISMMRLPPNSIPEIEDERTD